MAATLRRIVKSSPLLMRTAAPIYRMRSIALVRVPLKGSFPRFSGKAHLDAASFSSLHECEKWIAANAERIAEWEREDEDAAAKVAGQFAFTTTGHCAICDRAVDFLATTEYGAADSAGVSTPNWREQLICPGCQMRNRMRAALHLAIQDCGLTADKDIYITEQFGSGYRWLRGRFNHVLGSEYLGPNRASGFRRFGITHQDVQALSLETASVDSVLSFDVLEHVPNYLAAFNSFARVLRPGGRLVMTVPFTINKYETTVRAIMHSDGQIEHFMPIELHGNPTDPVNGALCYRHFGWDTLDQLTEVGFTHARVHVYHNRELGYLGGLQSLISAIKA